VGTFQDPKVQVKSLNLLVLRSSDIELARAFYACFGMTFMRHAHGKGPEHYAHEDERGVFEIYPTPPGAPPDNAGIGFGVPRLEEIACALRAIGAAPGEPKDNPWGRTFVVRDPDGRRVEVKEVR
jgi:catechol 2,3-dioxygenase-like lactoylglutathione lyase family enzyme